MSDSPTELFGGLYARGPVADAVSDRAWLDAMLAVEAALARASGLEAVARKIEAVEIDLAELAREAIDDASPVVALARMLRQRAGDTAHIGATSQDILDTAMMLISKRALEPLLTDAQAAATAAARLADEHRATPVMGRTLLQHALPTAFGLTAAGWMTGIDAACRRLRELRAHQLPVQMGGPVGNRDARVGERVAEELGLAAPAIPWHADRVGPANLACALGVLAGALAKVARDVTLLSQNELAEVREGVEGRGGSSSMPHKRNPVAATSILACTTRTPGLVATMLSAMEGEHQRSAGHWQAEWGTVTDLLRLTGSASAWARDLLEHLEVDTERMRLTAGRGPDLGAASQLIDRALAGRSS